MPHLLLAQETDQAQTGPDAGVPGVPEWLPGALLAAAVLVLIMVFFRRLHRRNAERETRTPAERIQAVRESAAQRDALSNLMADAEELTRRFAVQMDNKSERLEQLIAIADERIAQLERAEGRARAPRRDGSGGTDSARHESELHRDPIAHEVFRLADEGHPPVEIARQLGQHTGKVELILALRNA